jgi:hypothetical protein
MQLLDALEARFMRKPDQPHMPPEFLEQFAARFEDEGLPDLVQNWGEWSTCEAANHQLHMCSTNMVPEC